MIVENRNSFNIDNYKDIIKDYGIIYFNNNNHIAKIKNKEGNDSIIRIITYQSFKEELEFLKPKSFNFFLEKGLNKKANQKSTICLYRKNKTTKKGEIIYYSFNESNSRDNDIPFYHEGVPDGFSLFCTQNEYTQVLAHIKTEEYKKYIEKKKQKEKEEILETEPVPNKKGFLCQICKSRFDNYLEHIKSNLHKRNKSKYYNTFNKIKLTFKRISNYNNIKKININKITEEKKEINNQINIDENINIETTKEESISINENIIINKNLKISEKCNEINDEKNAGKINEKKDDISMKEILNILDSIEVQKNILNKNKQNIKKRKKNEINHYFETENYFRNLAIVTGKISYYNDLLKANK